MRCKGTAFRPTTQTFPRLFPPNNSTRRLFQAQGKGGAIGGAARYPPFVLLSAYVGKGGAIGGAARYPPFVLLSAYVGKGGAIGGAARYPPFVLLSAYVGKGGAIGGAAPSPHHAKFANKAADHDGQPLFCVI